MIEFLYEKNEDEDGIKLFIRIQEIKIKPILRHINSSSN